MTLSKTLRDEVGRKLTIQPRTLRERVGQKAIDAGVADRDIALLILAHESGINVAKPRFLVPQPKLDKLNQYLQSQRAPALVGVGPSPNNRKRRTVPQYRRLLKFKGKYPDIFYDRLEDEINAAYNDTHLPNAVMMLTRKLIENLVYNLLQLRFDGPRINLYFDTAHRRPQDFGVLLDNLKSQKDQFDADLAGSIDKFLDLAQPFRRDANSKVHNIVEYLSSMSQVKGMQVPEMTQLLLRLIDRVK